MKYKILIKSNASQYDAINYYKYYQVSSAEGDWESTDKDETIAKVRELLETYSLSDMKLVINLDIDITMDIPEIPQASVEETEDTTDDSLTD